MTGELTDIVTLVHSGGEPHESVRTLLRRFGFEKRGYHKVREVRQALDAAKLRTDPDFNSVPLDGEIHYYAKQITKASSPPPSTDLTPPKLAQQAGSIAIEVSSSDPTYRMKRLDDGTQELISVRPDDDLRRATTLMMSHDFSQLPVMSGRSIKGVVSWKSMGTRFALGGRPEFVREAMERDVATVEETSSLFAAIPRIIANDYALIRRHDGNHWIITTSDLSSRFRELAEPFLLLSEIENQLRGLLDEHLPKTTIQAAKDPDDKDRRIESAADLTLGEVLRLIEQQEVWDKLAPRLDRAEVVRQLDAIRNIRNDVMHFDPEGVGASDLETLRSFTRFLQDFLRCEPARTARLDG